MANCFYSGWPEEANWAQCHAAAPNKDSTFPVPCSLPSNDSASFQFHGFPSWSIPFDGFSEDRAASASKSHSQAEKRRRDRINAQLSTLRKLIPKSEKMDKAALLGSVIDHVKDLKRKAMEVSKSFTVPTEVDEVTIEYENDQAATNCPTTSCDKSREKIFIKASVCCDDRPELFMELIRALKVLKLTTVKADMASLGGRIKSILVLCTKDADEGVSVSNLKQSLSVVLSRIASSSAAPNHRITSKRQRFFLPSNYSQ